MAEEVFQELSTNVAGAVEAFKRELAKIRTGRANLTLLDGIRVDYYGNKSPLNQVASLAVADARLIVIKPWDKTLIPEIERSIRVSDLGLTPQNDGQQVRLPIPPLTEERRREFTKVARNRGEDAKVSVRNARRDANELYKEMDKSGEIPEDDAKKWMDKVQAETDRTVKLVDELVAKKEKEILEIG